MKILSINQYLPTEIIKKIVNNPILKQHDLIKCQLVCTLWYKLAQESLNHDIKINLNDADFERLSTDLIQYPSLASKTRYITLINSCTGTENPMTFRSIINHCPNLWEITIECLEVKNYLQTLDIDEIILPYIRNIGYKNLNFRNSFPVQIYHMELNYRFRKTIRHLELALFNMNNFNTIRNYHGNLLGYVSEFTCLKSISFYLCVSQDIELLEFRNFINNRSPMVEIVNATFGTHNGLNIDIHIEEIDIEDILNAEGLLMNGDDEVLLTW